MSYKEIYCRDCRLVLAKFNIKYFSDNTISELIKIGYSMDFTSRVDTLYQQGNQIEEDGSLSLDDYKISRQTDNYISITSLSFLLSECIIIILTVGDIIIHEY